MTPTLTLKELLWPALAVLVLTYLLLYIVAFDQGALASTMTHAMADKGGVLHEFFHDARHLLGVPCH